MVRRRLTRLARSSSPAQAFGLVLVEAAELLGVRDDVDRHDASTGDGERRQNRAGREPDEQARGTVDGDGLCPIGATPEVSGPACHGLGADERGLPERSRSVRAAVHAQDHIEIEDPQQTLEVAVTGGGEEPVPPTFGDRPAVVVAVWVSLSLLFFIGTWLGTLSP